MRVELVQPAPSYSVLARIVLDTSPTASLDPATVTACTTLDPPICPAGLASLVTSEPACAVLLSPPLGVIAASLGIKPPDDLKAACVELVQLAPVPSVSGLVVLDSSSALPLDPAASIDPLIAPAVLVKAES